LPEVPPAPALPGDPVERLRATNGAAGVSPQAQTATPRWLGARLDVGYAIDVLHPRAIEPAEPVKAIDLGGAERIEL
jgi:hypothetical protein